MGFGGKFSVGEKVRQIEFGRRLKTDGRRSVDRQFERKSGRRRHDDAAVQEDAGAAEVDVAAGPAGTEKAVGPEWNLQRRMITFNYYMIVGTNRNRVFSFCLGLPKHKNLI